MSDVVQPLTIEESDRLARLEKTVLENENAALSYVVALREIRDRRLYRATHTAFSAYCLERFGMTARAINNNIQAISIRDSIIEEAQKLPDDQRVAVEESVEGTSVKALLATAWLKQNRRVDAILAARELSHGKPVTAKVVEQAIAKISHRANPVPEFAVKGALADLGAKMRGEPDLDIAGPWSHSGGHLVCGHVAVAKILVSRRSGSTALLDLLCERLNHPPLSRHE